MNLIDRLENGSFMMEEGVFQFITYSINRKVPILLFINMSSVQFLNKFIPIYNNKNRIKDNSLSPEEWNLFDLKMNELYNAPLWLNDIEVNSVDDYKSAEEVVVNEKIKYVFIDSIPETIDKSEIIKWSEEVGFNVYFIRLTLE